MTTTKPSQHAALVEVRQLLQQGKTALAAQHLKQLALTPADGDGYVQFCYLHALIERLSQRPAEALTWLAALAEQQPNYGRCFQEQGYCYLLLQQPERAANAFFRATRANPALIASWKMLQRIHQQRGDRQASELAESKHQALAQLPPSLLAATDLRYEGELDKAEQLCREFLLQHKQHAEGMMLLADIGLLRKAYPEAEFLLESCVEFNPQHGPARLALVHVYSKLGKFAQAQPHAQQLHQQTPQDAAIISAYTHVLLGIGAMAQAIAILQEALSANAERPALWLTLGHAYKAQGNANAAVEAYRKAAHLSPTLGDAYWSLANIKTYTFSDQELGVLERLAQNANLSVDDKVHIAFALGYAYESRQHYDQAFIAYTQGNRLKHRLIKPDITRFETAMQAQQQACRKALFSDAKGGCTDPAPIFIVGMPRAGSTLLEQILASHPLVEGTMELHDILSLVARVSGREKPYPYVLSDMHEDEFTRLGEAYIAATKAYRTDKPFFIDKMPNNFVHIGFIKRILPQAKIIDARRDPFACCFSVYKQLFAEGQEFSYDLADLGRYYRAYVALMDHWQQVLPAQILRVQYEEVLADLEGQVRRLLAYCNLPFDERCLRFYETERAVKTPSAEQVRQPLYQSSKQHWRHFEKHLQPLFAHLETPE